jgi:hypothetical protein
MQNERNILTVTIIYFISCALAVITLAILISFLGLNFLDPSFFTGAIKYLLLPLAISIFIGYVITIATYQSQKKYAILSVFLTLIILLIIGTIYSSYTCEELGCIATGFIYFAVLIVLVPFSASIPIFFQEIPIPVSLILVIIMTSLISVITSFRMITTRVAQKAEVKKEQAIIRESGIPIYETNYQKFTTKKLIFDNTSDNRNKNLEPTKSVTHNDFNWLTYEGYWLDNQRAYRIDQDKYELNIRELKPAKNFSDEELYSRDFAELQKYKEFEASLYKIQLEGIKINNYPAIYISNGFRDQKLRIYRQGVIIEIRIDVIGQGTFPKEELIKVGESLQAANKP